MRPLLLLLVASMMLHQAFAMQIEPSQEEFSIDVLNVRRGLLSNFVTKVVSDENNLKFFVPMILAKLISNLNPGSR